MKSERQSVILDIVESIEIETQYDLMKVLTERGIKSTQATISRDIKDLRLIKKKGLSGKYVYASPDRNESENVKIRLGKIFKESVVSFDIAQNIFVIRTLAGLASAASATIDSMEIDGVVGSLAGDDTVFLAMRDNSAALQLYYEIEKLL